MPLAVFGALFGIAGALVLAKAGYTQVLHSAAIMGEGTLVTQADGARRYQYNPRLQEIMREIPKGTIYDRNGLPLATSNWDELEKHRAEYQQLGIDIDRACPRTEARHYPFGGLMFDLLGDLRTRTRWAASNTSYVERDSARRLRGYDDRPTLEEVKNPKTGKIGARHPLRLSRTGAAAAPSVRAATIPPSASILDRPRDVAHVHRCAPSGARRGDPAQAIASRPTGQGRRRRDGSRHRRLAGRRQLSAAPRRSRTTPSAQPESANPYLDRARYGLYPPGSTFKVVTAIAAMRKDAHLAIKHVPVRPPARWARRQLHEGLQPSHSRRRAGYRAARHARYGARHRGLLQCLLRAIGHLRRRRRAAVDHGQPAGYCSRPLPTPRRS